MTKDIHRERAAEHFGVKLEDVTDDQRREGKRLNYWSMYSTLFPYAGTPVGTLAGLTATGRFPVGPETQYKCRFIRPGAPSLQHPVHITLELDSAAIEARVMAYLEAKGGKVG